MALISCPECGWQVSSAAEACPQCGYPIRSAAPESTEPSCYACSSTATTRCQNCGKFSCAKHLEPIFVHHGKGGGHELRCQSCFKEAKDENRTLWVIAGVILTLVAIFLVLVGVNVNTSHEQTQKKIDQILKDAGQRKPEP